MVRILDATAVDALLTPAGALEAMRDLFKIAGDPESVGYGRSDLAHRQGWLRILPGFIEPLGVFGFKTLNRAAGVGMRYAIYVHDLESGALIGMVDGLSITHLRTGAVTALATDHLCVADPRAAALVGTGPVARGQLRVLDLVRSAPAIRVYARTPEKRRALVAEMAGTVRSHLVEADSLESALEGADLVTVATNSPEAIIHDHHLSPGMHLNSVGPASRDRREVAPEAFARFDRIVCDSADLVFGEAGDAVDAEATGAVQPGAADDLSDLVAGSRPGRDSNTELTLFKSVGSGLQDLIVAARLLEAAAADDIGTTVDDYVAVKEFVTAGNPPVQRRKP